MINMFLSGWFLITTYAVDGDQHNYLLNDPQTNTIVSASTQDPLPYGENRWIKLRMTAECHKSYDYDYYKQYGRSTIPLITTICSANKIQELKCTEANSFVMNGIRYC